MRTGLLTSARNALRRSFVLWMNPHRKAGWQIRKRAHKAAGETLESRVMLTTYFVDGAAAAGGDGSQVNPFDTIQAGVAAAAANPGDDIVAIAAGRYIITNTGPLLVSDTSGAVTFVGAGATPAETYIQTRAGDGMEITASGDVSIINMRFYLGDRGVWIHDTTGDVKFDNVIVEEVAGFGIQASNTNNISFNNSTVRNNSNDGFNALTVGNVSIVDSSFTGNSDGAQISAAQIISISNSTMDANLKDGLLVNTASSLTVFGGTYNNNGFRGLSAGVDSLSVEFTEANDNSSVGVQIAGGDDATIRSVDISRNGRNGTAGGLTARSLRNSLTIEDVNVVGNSGHGIFISGGPNTVSANMVQSRFNGRNGILVRNADSVSISNSLIDNNASRGLDLEEFHSVAIDHVNATSNGSLTSGIVNGGAGIFLNSTFEGATISVTNSDISDNVSPTHGGGLYVGWYHYVTLDNVAVTGNTAGGTGFGGGIYFHGGIYDSSFTNVLIANNTAAQGGGLAHGIFGSSGTAALLIEDSTIRNNTAEEGGGIFHQYRNLILRRTSVFDNQATSNLFGGGGGLYLQGATTIENSTISGNRSSSNGGGIASYGSNVQLIHGTIANNFASNLGGGIYREGTATSVSLANTIVGANQAADGSQDYHGAFFSLSYNLIGTATGSTGASPTFDIFGTDASPIDPRLLPINDNGGPTQTHALLSDSPALNAVGATNFVYATDQRGVARPQGSARDIGAFEFEISGNTAPQAYPQNQTIFEDTLLNGVTTGFDLDGDPLTFQLVTGPTHAASFSLQSDGSFSYLPTENYFGPDKFTFRAFDGQAYSTEATVNIVTRSVNDAPIVTDDDYSATEDQTLIVSAVNGVLANDSDVENQPLSASLLTDASNGSVVMNNDGSFTYTPNADFFGSDSFEYLADDGNGGTTPGTVTINVANVNDTPTASWNPVSLDENAPVGTLAGTVVASDADGDLLTYLITSGNDAGAFTIDSSGAITVADSAPLDFETTPVFTLTVNVSDPSGANVDVAATINLNDVLEYIPAPVDALPGDDTNILNVADSKSFDVAIDSTSDLDVSLIDIDSLTLDIDGVSFQLKRNKKGVPRISFVDTNGDGVVNRLIATFEIGDTSQLVDGLATLTVSGLVGGEDFLGTDQVTIETTSQKGKGGGKGNGNGNNGRRPNQ